jgi:hypothetical protein
MITKRYSSASWSTWILTRYAFIDAFKFVIATLYDAIVSAGDEDDSKVSANITVKRIRKFSYRNSD